jgi:hypothetical protein
LLHLSSAIFEEAITFHRPRAPRGCEPPVSFGAGRSQVNAALCSDKHQ